MAVTWNSALINILAPGLASFSTAEIPELTPDFSQAAYWVSNFFLNTIYGRGYASRFHQAVLGYLRRSESAFRSYHAARRLTLDHVAGFETGVPRLTSYYAAINEWEIFALQTQMAIDLYTFIANKKAFEPGDGTSEQRLYDIGNAVKHLRGRIASQEFSDQDILPLWVDSSGIKSFEYAVTFTEAAAILRDLAKLADILQYPEGIREAAEQGD